MNVLATPLRAAALLAPILFAACGSPPPEAPVAESPDAERPAAGDPAAQTPPAAAPGRIAGSAGLERARERSPIDMSADQRCLDLHDHPVLDRVIAADPEGRLANVFVYLKEGVPPEARRTAAADGLLDQVGCLFVPRVQGVRAGQRLVVRNSDPTLHNVQAQPRHNPAFNFGQPFQGMERVLQFANPEVMIPFRCDVHPWMASYLGVLDHPFWAVSAADGSYALEGVPPGDYLVEAWHEVLPPRRQRVSVAAGATLVLDFAWGEPPGE